MAQTPSEPPPTTIAEDPLTTPPLDFKLANADINALIQFITEHTGKPVMKEKSVNAKLTISAPDKVLPYQALDLLYDALLLEGFAVIETEDLIRIVPVADTGKFDMATYSRPLPEEVKRQKSQLIRRIIQLQNVRPEVVKTQLDPLLGKHASINVDSRTNKIIIVDTVRNIERYESILTELDIVGFDNMEVRIVQLQHADAAALADILQETVVKASTGGAPPQPGQKAEGGIAIIPDPRTNSLVITAPIDKTNSIVDFINRLDVPKPKEVGVHVVPMKFADAQSIAGAIADIFRRTTGKALQDTVEVRATGRNNALLILASDENFELIMEVIKSLDTEDAQKRETRKYELKHLDAEDTAKELEKLYGESQQNRNPYFFVFSYRNNDEVDVKFVPITRSNSILVIAPPSEFSLVEDLIKEIDQPINVDDVLPKIYRLKYARAIDVKDVLTTVFGGDSGGSGYQPWWMEDQEEEAAVGRLTGKIKFTADENTNSIIAISNNASNYAVVDQMIERLDRMDPELANTLILPLQHADATALANVLNTLFGKPVKPEGQRGEDAENVQDPFTFWWGADSRQEDETPISNLIEQVRFVPDPRTNSLLVTTAAQNFETIRGFITNLDNEEPQVLIKVRVVEVTRANDKRTGVRWTPDAGTYSPEDLENSVRVLQGLDFVDTFGGATGGPMDVTRSGLRNYDVSQQFDGRRGIISSTVNLDLLIQMLLKNTNSEMVINPTLYVSNNQAGHIFVGQNIPRLTATQLTPEGTRNDTYENEDIGIDMLITPNISKNGQVVLKVKLNTSQTTGETRFGSDVIQKREYDTKVAVTGGETVVLGGIRLETDQEIVRKVPFLGDLPVLGRIFRNRVKTDGVTDLYAFITPEVVSTAAEAARMVEEVESSIGAPRVPILPDEKEKK
jgi:type II secretion system protein D